MPKFRLTCTYCNDKWEAIFWSEQALMADLNCKQCRDTRIRIKQVDQENGNDVFGYRFSPPFAPKTPTFDTE